jgi:hypothetical protein
MEQVMSEELKAKIAELKAWKIESMETMEHLFDYARTVCTGQLGCSLADWLVSDHKKSLATITEQAREIEINHCLYASALIREEKLRTELATLKDKQGAVVLPEQVPAASDYYRSMLRAILKDIRDEIPRGGLPQSWNNIAEAISETLRRPIYAAPAPSVEPAHSDFLVDSIKTLDEISRRSDARQKRIEALASRVPEGWRPAPQRSDTRNEERRLAGNCTPRYRS